MITQALITQAVAIAEKRAKRPGASVYSGRAMVMIERALFAAKSSNWLIIVSGFVEPVLYLMAFGFGIGQLIGDIQDGNGNPATLKGLSYAVTAIVQAEATCPELLGNLIGATATIPETERETEGDGPRDLPIIPLPDVVTIPVDEEPDTGTDPETPPPDGIDPLPDTEEVLF